MIFPDRLEPGRPCEPHHAPSAPAGPARPGSSVECTAADFVITVYALSPLMPGTWGVRPGLALTLYDTGREA